MFIRTIVLVALVASVISEEGVSNNDDWAYQWYSGESFRFRCHISGLNVTEPGYVTWETADHKVLSKHHNDTEYELFKYNMVDGFELLIKNVNPNVHGVYICKVFTSGGEIRGHTIYGLNIHEVKYHVMMDKYKSQINVALIATAVFLVPILTTCLVWHFQYVTPEMEARARRRKMGQKPYSISNEMQTTNGHLADTVASPEWNGAYENKEVFTQL
ncbi:uncharacterized protein LOC132736343 [Ruditapes philippinarum]|uniref:uncharacterized protein LOC132736343 n=1 Tax=Ruditapes philippinarum TaxID=129788 RepID=UPI00295BB702|nr:uncharacterized protein LOC132736343 [Ruditapes philippinarum]